MKRPGLLACTAAALTLALAAGALAAPRAFPSTKDRVRVFADQLPNQLTDAQARFVASHYAGSQKQAASWTRRIRRLNPDYLMLHYQLAVGAGPALFLEGDRWVNDFEDVSKHAEWFVQDAQGRRIRQTAWDWYVMDVRERAGEPRTGFLDYWVRTAIRRMRLNEADGVFADSYTQDILMNQVEPSIPLFGDVATNKREWLPSLNRFGARVAARLHSEPERFYYLPNLGGQVTTWDTVTDILVGDGGMVEGFATPSPGEYFSQDDWRLQMARVLNLGRRGKVVLAQTGVSSGIADHRWFVIGSYLLTRGPRSYINMMEKGTLEWWPEYALDLGAYSQEPPADLSVLAWRDGRLLRRDYEKGFVLVNPTAEPVDVAELGGAFHVVSAAGGGAVPEDGSEPGRLISAPVRSLAIPARSARVLLAKPCR